MNSDVDTVRRQGRPKHPLLVGLAGCSVLLAACGAGHASGSHATTTTTTKTAGSSSTTTPTTTATPTTAATSTTEPAADATTQVPLVVPSGNGSGALSTPHTLTLPAGWTAEVWARVTGARMEAWTPGGDLLVSMPNAGDVVELTPASTPSAVPTQRVLLSGLTNPQGLAFAKVGGHETLFVGESNAIDRYPWTGEGIAGPKTVIAGDLPDLDPAGDDVHRYKDIAIGRNGTVYFDVGSSSNANPDDRTASPQRGVIMSVQPDGSDLHVVTTGVRNGEGLSIAPDGTLWSAINERDNVPYPFHQPYGGVSDAFGRQIQSYVDEHPPDEVASITQGRDLGWPYCNPDQDESTPAGSMIHVPLVADAVTNPNGTALDCASLAPVEVGLPAHSAPLGFHFLEGSTLPAPWSGGAVVAVHGSWDRQPPRAPAVLWMPWNSTSDTLQASVTLVGGFQDANGDRWGRPADAVAGPDGALYVSDDTAGAIYRIIPATDG
jgi:glucose/arabinose dehydrogenase